MSNQAKTCGLIVRNTTSFLFCLLALTASSFLVSCSGGLVVQSDANLSAVPAGGSYKAVQKIELVANKDVAIFYTLDGSDPYDNSAAKLYDPKVGIVVGDAEVNSIVDLKFYSIQKQSDGSLGYMSNKIYSERYIILVDEIPPVTKPGVNTGIFSKNFDLKLSSSESSTTYYCAVEQFISDECTVSSCLPDKIYLAGQNLDLLKDAVPLKDLQGQETTKICLVYQSMDRSQNKGPVMKYDYIRSYDAPDISSLLLQSNIIPMDGFTQLRFKSSDIKAKNVIDKLDALEKVENDFNFGTDSELDSDSVAITQMSEADRLIEKRKLTPLKLEVRVANQPVENINEVIASIITDYSGTSSRVSLKTLLSPFGRSAMGDPLDFVDNEDTVALNGFTVSFSKPYVDMRILGCDLVPGSQQILGKGDNQFYLFLVDTTVTPPKISYFNSTVSQVGLQNPITMKATQGDNVVMSADNKFRLIGNTLGTQTEFELRPLE